MAVNEEHAVAISSEMFGNGLNEKDLITLIAGDGGQRIPIHRVILMENSKYFAALLGPNFREANEDEFILDETDGSTLKAIVDFCYTGNIDLTEENVSKYSAFASGVELFRLEQKCSLFFTEKLNENNVLTMLGIAEKFNCQVLRQKAIDFVCESFHKLPQPLIDGMDCRLLEEILKNDGFDAEEQFIFERVLSWYRKDQDERKQQMNGLLKLIRLPLIPTKYFNGDTMQKIYREFGCLEYTYAESIRRITCPTSNAGIRRRRTIYCLFKQYETRFEPSQIFPSRIKIGRYNSVLNEFGGVGEIDLGQLQCFGAAFYENKVYIFGGEIDGVAQKSVLVLDLSSGGKRILPEMTSAHNNSDPLLVGKFIYMIGGKDGFFNVASCERFDLETETWETLEPMRFAQTGIAVAELNGYIYVAGGYNLLLSPLKDVELYDPQNNEWMRLAPMLNAQYYCKLLAFKSYLYAVGNTSSIERYDPLTNCWTKIGSLDPRIHIASSVVVDDSIYVITKDGTFGEMKIDENEGCSFIPIVKSEYETEFRTRHCLFHNN